MFRLWDSSTSLANASFGPQPTTATWEEVRAAGRKSVVSPRTVGAILAPAVILLMRLEWTLAYFGNQRPPLLVEVRPFTLGVL